MHIYELLYQYDFLLCECLARQCLARLIRDWCGCLPLCPVAVPIISHAFSGIIIIIKKDWQCKAGRERLTPYQSEDPNRTSPTHIIIEEKKKTAGDRK